MARTELGIFEDDPRSQAGADAIDLLNSVVQKQNTKVKAEESWASSDYLDYLDDDPRTVATKAAIEEARSWEAYRQSGAWTMHEGQEYSPREQ